MDDCTFCGIVAGRLPSFRVLEDEHTLAFLDIRPASRGHTLVVPREHAPGIWAISEAAHGRVARMVHRVAALLKAALDPDGVNVRHATGEAAGQDVLHFHAHVIPRWHGDGLPAPWSAQRASPGHLGRVLAQITSPSTDEGRGAGTPRPGGGSARG
ncbi:HIT domain-containing protein [Nonomuraea phyllanthi]|uniref:HIT domain-containing protein n=1 Tax=Nonomuraea phyllanthi TaxID=2219224 RepID=A0A5C4VXP1_9ACTN|nr:HIT family protein [Nonomuraea phyllanthi]KAB8190651.1 HIT domain-containing protein [Nonomuraea phyllanthi]QFY05825.1 HIT domain-containing protein [Nonomuraea phyllanthi]